MSNKHEPDPGFVQSLEWQLRRELRRSTEVSQPKPAARFLKITALMLCSVTLGAMAMDTTQQIQESWRNELLEARLEVQLQMARQRLEKQLETVLGLRTGQELAHHELAIAEAKADAEILELKLEEIRQSGREPLGELSSPLVDGRDFVSERVETRMEAARLRLDVAQRAGESTLQRVEAGLIQNSEGKAAALLILEAELELQSLSRKLDLRSSYLDSEFTAIEAELMLLEEEARTRIMLVNERWRFLNDEMQRLQALIEAGMISPVAAVDVQTQLAEIESELRQADEELRIVRDELERREQPN